MRRWWWIYYGHGDGDGDGDGTVTVTVDGCDAMHGRWNSITSSTCKVRCDYIERK